MDMGLSDAVMTTPEAGDADHLATHSPVLHVALSARLGLDPSEMGMYRSDMFPQGQAPANSGCLCFAKRAMLSHRSW